jgi:hypothetical protein
MRHGTRHSHKCRCEECRKPKVDHEALRDLLLELFPDGLTEDCPVAREKRAREAWDRLEARGKRRVAA